MPTQSDAFYAKAQEVERTMVAMEAAWDEHGILLRKLRRALELREPKELRLRIDAMYDRVEVALDGHEDIMDALKEEAKEWHDMAAAADPYERYNI